MPDGAKVTPARGSPFHPSTVQEEFPPTQDVATAFDYLAGPHWSDFVHVWAPEWDDERDDD